MADPPVETPAQRSDTMLEVVKMTTQEGQAKGETNKEETKEEVYMDAHPMEDDSMNRMPMLFD